MITELQRLQEGVPPFPSDALPAARDYYWHARAQGAGTTGVFGATFKFTVGPAITISQPVPIAPLTGAQTNLYNSPLHRGESLDLSPEDAERLELSDGEIALVSSRRGSVEAPVRIDQALRPGLAFMTFHFPDQVDTNQLTIDATDPKSGTAEFKATAVRIEKLPAPVSGGGA